MTVPCTVMVDFPEPNTHLRKVGWVYSETPVKVFEIVCKIALVKGKMLFCVFI